MIKHIIYRTTHKITGEYYIGLHKLNVLKPTCYWGSYWQHQPVSVRPHLVREILAEYPDRESARQAEPHWIAPHLGDPLCKNTHARELPEGADRADKPGGMGMLGKKHTPEAIEKNRQSHLGKPRSAETRAKHSLAISGENNHMWGKSRSEETRAKISESQKGKPVAPSEIVTCPHCGESGKARGMKRWHFDNCKKKP